MFARFDENPVVTPQGIKETKSYGRTHVRTDAGTHRQNENSIPTTNKVCWGYKKQKLLNKADNYKGYNVCHFMLYVML